MTVTALQSWVVLVTTTMQEVICEATSPAKLSESLGAEDYSLESYLPHTSGL